MDGSRYGPTGVAVIQHSRPRRREERVRRPDAHGSRAGSGRHVRRDDEFRSEPSDAPDEPTAKALRAFTRASILSNNRVSLFSHDRVGWLLDRFSIEGLRGRVVRALGLRPDFVSIDPDKFASLLPRAVPSKHGTTIGVCADAATLGPFSDGRLAIESLELSAAQSYQDEDWVPACVAWLAPSKSAGLTEQGEMLWLLSLRDGTLATKDEPSKQLKTLFELWSVLKTNAVGDLPRRMASRAGHASAARGLESSGHQAAVGMGFPTCLWMPDQVWPIRRAWPVRTGFPASVGDSGDCDRSFDLLGHPARRLSQLEKGSDTRLLQPVGTEDPGPGLRRHPSGLDRAAEAVAFCTLRGRYAGRVRRVSLGTKELPSIRVRTSSNSTFRTSSST